MTKRRLNTVAAGLAGVLTMVAASSPAASGQLLQWRPQKEGKDVRLQDFCFFEYGGRTVIASMMKDFCDKGITLARSKDLVRWEALGTALRTRTAQDSSMVWAPHVVRSRDVYYMFYTGVTTPKPGQWCQRILVASSRVPDDPASWNRSADVEFIVGDQAQNWFRPSHTGAVWSDSAWADCRDPMVLESGGTWHMFYTGRDQGAGICGVATAPSVLGPWTDRGAVLEVANPTIPESCFVLREPEGGFVMVFNHAAGGPGSTVARSRLLLPVNGKPCFRNLEPLEKSAKPGLKGWAHEFLPRGGTAVLAAYLTGYFITFAQARLVEGKKGWTISGAAPE